MPHDQVGIALAGFAAFITPAGDFRKDRRANRADLRESFLSLTPAGRAVYEELAPSALAFMDRLAEVVAAADRPAFDRAMKQLTKRSAELVAEAEGGKI